MPNIETGNQAGSRFKGPASLRFSHRSCGSTVASGRRAGVRVKLPSPLTSARRISGDRPDLSASHGFVADGIHQWLHNFRQLDSLILVDSFTLQRLRRIAPAGSRVDENRRPTFDLGFVDASIWNSMTRGSCLMSDCLRMMDRLSRDHPEVSSSTFGAPSGQTRFSRVAAP